MHDLGEMLKVIEVKLDWCNKKRAGKTRFRVMKPGIDKLAVFILAALINYTLLPQNVQIGNSNTVGYDWFA
jgi:hypothetical protein